MFFKLLCCYLKPISITIIFIFIVVVVVLLIMHLLLLLLFLLLSAVFVVANYCNMFYNL